MSEEPFSRMIEALGIIIDKRPKERPRKIENYTIGKVGCVVPIFGSVWGQVLKYNKYYIIFAACPCHYVYNFQEQFITSLPEEIICKRSFLILKKLGGI